jgi:hypothetical protein
MVGPDPGDGHAADPKMVGQGAGRPVSDAKALGWAGQGGGDDRGASGIADGAGPARAWLVDQAVQAVGGVAAAPADHRWARAANGRRYLGVGLAVSGQQHDPGSLGQTSSARGRACPAAKSPGVLSVRVTGTAVFGMPGILAHPPPIAMELQGRNTSKPRELAVPHCGVRPRSRVRPVEARPKPGLAASSGRPRPAARRSGCPGRPGHGGGR